MKIGMFITATGKYKEFINPFIESMNKYFFADDIVTLFITTDISYPDMLNGYLNMLAHNPLRRIYTRQIERKGFPGDTLYRYRYILAILDSTKIERQTCTEMYDENEFDYLFYSDVDMRFVSYVSRETLPNESEGLVGVQHPGFYGGGWGSPHVNTLSTAWLEPSKRKIYLAGGFQGGRAKEYLQMCRKLKDNIDADDKIGVLAEWHDESHYNKYMADKSPKILTPAYCYPESWNLPFEKKLLALDKDHALYRKLN